MSIQKFLLVVFCWLFFAGSAGAETVGNVTAAPAAVIDFSTGADFRIKMGAVANMPGSPAFGSMYIVTDAAGAGLCTAGGSTTSLCVYNGAAWEPAGDGGAGVIPTQLTDLDTTVTGAELDQNRIDTGLNNTHRGVVTGNPHQVTAAEVGADPAGTSVSAISTHEGAADPHTGYLLETDYEARSVTITFLNTDLTAGVLTITHNLAEAYPSAVIVWDNNNNIVSADEITSTGSNSLTIDLSSWGTLTGTWHASVRD